MLFESEVWEKILIAAAAYLAVASLVHLMREYRRQMIVRLKAGLIKRQLTAKPRRSSSPDPESSP